jgi:hypothetical protein
MFFLSIFFLVLFMHNFIIKLMNIIFYFNIYRCNHGSMIQNDVEDRRGSGEIFKLGFNSRGLTCNNRVAYALRFFP